LIVTDTPEYAPDGNVLILAVSPFNLHSDSEIEERYIEITKQSFSGNTFALLQKVIYMACAIFTDVNFSVETYSIDCILTFKKRHLNDTKSSQVIVRREIQNGNGIHDEDQVSNCKLRENIELSDVSAMLAGGTKEGSNQSRWAELIVPSFFILLFLNISFDLL
jgi:hypothetical protein